MAEDSEHGKGRAMFEGENKRTRAAKKGKTDKVQKWALPRCINRLTGAVK